MRMKKDKWTNVISYEPEDSLKEEDFIKVKDQLRSVWRTLGWIHLRMTNDVDTKSRSPLRKPEIRERIDEVMSELQKIIDDDLKENG